MDGKFVIVVITWISNVSDELDLRYKLPLFFMHTIVMLLLMYHIFCLFYCILIFISSIVILPLLEWFV